MKLQTLTESYSTNLKVDKYMDQTLNKSDNRWKSITLTNLCKEMTSEEAKETYDKLLPLLKQYAKDRVAKLKGLNAPESIMAPEMKNHDKIVLRNKHTHLARLFKKF